MEFGTGDGRPVESARNERNSEVVQIKHVVNDAAYPLPDRDISGSRSIIAMVVGNIRNLGNPN